MKHNKNFRTLLKYLHKEIQRNVTNTKDILRSFQKITGMSIHNREEIGELLRTNIPARILRRISNAAKKRGMIVEANEFIVLDSILNKKGIYKQLPIHCPRFDYRDIPFKKVTNRIVTEKYVEVSSILFGFDGKPLTRELIEDRSPVFARQEKVIEG